MQARLEDLQCQGLKIWQRPDLYTFTSDSVILANFLQCKHTETALEIGTGSGIISILACAKKRPKHIYAFEMQAELAALATKNVQENGLADAITVIADRIQNFQQYLPQESMDVVFSNPPYMTSLPGSTQTSRYLARHEDALRLPQLCESIRKLLRFGGRAYLVYGASRSCELITTLVQQQLQPKRMFFTENGRGKTILIVVEAVKGGKSGVQVLPNLITNEADGKYLEALHTKMYL